MGKMTMKERALIRWVCVCLLSGSGMNAVASTGAPGMFNPEPFNLTKAVGDAEVLLVADDHTQPEIKDFLGRQLQPLRMLGFHTLGIEMLPSHCQPDLDSWNAAARHRILQHLEEFWGEKGPGVPLSILRLIEEAKRQRLTVLAIDSDGLSDTGLRSAYWVKTIQRCRCGNKDGSRMIVFGGASHFRGDSGTVPSLLKEQGVRVSLLEFSGLEKADSIDLEWKTAEVLQRPIPGPLQVALENERLRRHGIFMVSDAKDWVVNLEPHTEVALAITR
jgi:hypothetical protein